ncbi:MAG: IclR family transcriptional regulator [Lautropia sp.]
MPKPSLPKSGLATTAASSPRETAPRETGTVRRVLMLLDCLADRPGAPVNEVAARLGLPRSTTHRLLAMLRADGFAQQQADGSHVPGSALYRIAGRVAAEVPYQRLAQPLLDRLSRQFEETAVLSLLARGQLRMFYAACAYPSDPMRYNIALNRSESLQWGATSRVLLAHLTTDEIETVLARREPSPLGARPAPRAQLLGDLESIRTSGHAVTVSHRTAGAVGIAVPFFDGRGEVVGGFAFLVPEFRYRAQRLPALLQGLGSATRAMTRQLGGA